MKERLNVTAECQGEKLLHLLAPNKKENILYCYLLNFFENIIEVGFLYHSVEIGRLGSLA